MNFQKENSVQQTAGLSSARMVFGLLKCGAAGHGDKKHPYKITYTKSIALSNVLNMTSPLVVLPNNGIAWSLEMCLKTKISKAPPKFQQQSIEKIFKIYVLNRLFKQIKLSEGR